MSALMSNFDIARETLNTAMYESEGSAERELASYQKGIEYSFDKFKASFQELSTTTVDSDFLKSIVDGGTIALDVITSLIDKFGILTNLMGIGGGILGLKGLGKNNVMPLSIR